MYQNYESQKLNDASFEFPVECGRGSGRVPRDANVAQRCTSDKSRLTAASEEFNIRRARAKTAPEFTVAARFYSRVH